METLKLTTSAADIKIAAEKISSGGIVAFPTETVYGLGANAFSADAVNKIFKAKGRPADNPLIVHIADISALDEIVSGVPSAARKLMDKFWPGPLTIIMKKNSSIPSAVSAGLDTVAVRMPENETARALIRAAGVPIAAPSANISGRPSPTRAEDVVFDMDGRIDAVIDGGDCSGGVESTVVSVESGLVSLLRPGIITAEQLSEAVGGIEIVTELKQGETPKSPGLKYKHYSPRAELIVLSGSLDDVISFVEDKAKKRRVGLLMFEEFKDKFSSAVMYESIGSRKSAKAAAHRLFSAMRALDAGGAEVIYAPEIPNKGIWRAVRNRLYRAAGERILNVSSSVKNVLFVCTGNTCRSPMAEGIFNTVAKERGLSAQAESAGLCSPDMPVSENAALAMKEIGIDISAHHSRPLTRNEVENADLILTMTRAHKLAILTSSADCSGKLYTLCEYAGDENSDVTDPYGGSLDDYRACRDNLKQLIVKVIDKIEEDKNDKR